MAERHRTATHDLDPVQDIEEELPPLDKAAFHQEHTVTKDCLVTIHGGIFTVKDGVYAWKLSNPKKEEIPLIDSRTADPMFIPTDLGDYTARLTTTEGRADFIFHVVEP